jgi:hypothetical protein
MKTTTFACCLTLLSAGLCAGAPAVREGERPAAAQPAASGTAGVTAAAPVEGTAVKKSVRRAPRGPVRPRLFWLRRMSK